MEFRQLRTFLAVAAKGTVTDAAIAVDLAPSSVSEQVRALERSLGVSLFDRTPEGMRPTEAGRRMTTWARRLLDQADQARREVTGRPAVVRLGTLETLAATLVPDIIERLAARRPDLGVEVSPLNRRDVLAGVEDGSLDAGLLLDSGPAVGGLGFDAPPRLDFLDVEEVPLAYVTAPGASRDRLLVTPPGCSFRMIADRVLGTDGERTELGSVTVIHGWARRGLGAALLPEFAVAEDLRSGALVGHPVVTPDIALRLVWRADREDSVRELLYAAAGGVRDTACPTGDVRAAAAAD
ncbi:LysR family transcriptional regulator [Actinoallomurus rhizosphaericola]|uniref:LysR family transcriptional regulator n=1 Tax=Actinoallomurus rhizosphaericola TaxID=2952536 RepID=UPI0020900F60|nr:LysR family transcriptional regulator [Actinoallomurus rhizosphaericola]MCO5993861.1 LysR family transcriptional regulator [Actinoallomurus rhizosphaericola]